MPQTTIYKNHVITVTHELTTENNIYTCKALDDSGAPVVSLQYFCNSMPIVDPHVSLLEEAKKQIDNKENIQLFKTYRHNGLKYISTLKPMASTTFVRGDTKYQFSHTCAEMRYHYKAMPVININDFVQFEEDGQLWQIKFINYNNQHGIVYYAVNDNMDLKTFGTVGPIKGFCRQKDAPAHFEINDKNDRAMSVRLPSYIYEILHDEVNARAGYGLTMNSTIRECIMFAIDQYFKRKE